MRLVVICLTAFLSVTSFGAQYLKPNFKLAPEYVTDAHLRTYAEVSGEIQGRANLNYKLGYNHDFNEQYAERFELKKIYLEKSLDNIRMTGGFHIVSWSETFGVNILDVVHPRDFRQNIFIDDSELLRSQLLLNMEYFLGSSSLQLLLAPMPVANIYPTKKSFFNVYNLSIDEDSADFFSRPEYGLKVTHLLDSGLEMSALFYHHQNRFPSFDLVFETSEPILKARTDTIETLGFAMSYATGDWTFRFDSVKRFDHEQSFASVFSSDWTKVDLTITSQIYYEKIFDEWYLMEQISYNYFTDFIPSISVVKSFNGSDAWLKPKILYSVNDRFNIRGEGNLLFGNNSSALLGPYLGLDHFKLSAEFYF